MLDLRRMTWSLWWYWLWPCSLSKIHDLGLEVSELSHILSVLPGMQRWEDRQGPASDTDGLTGDGSRTGGRKPLGVGSPARPSTRDYRDALRSKPKPSTPTRIPSHTIATKREGEGGRLLATAASAPSCHWLQPPGGILAPAWVRPRHQMQENEKTFFPKRPM